MKEEGFVYDLELEFALIWASPLGIACCHLAAARDRGMAGLQKPSREGSCRGERHETERAVELRRLPLLPQFRSATRAATQQPEHAGQSVLKPAASLPSQAL